MTPLIFWTSPRNTNRCAFIRNGFSNSIVETLVWIWCKVYVDGASATAPLIAGYLSSINCNKFINNIIYPLKGVGFHDITRGNDGSFSASSGYDVCSGWGSVNASV